jgi:hypothetical protein
MTSKTVSLFFLLVFTSTTSLTDQVRMSEQRFELEWQSNSDSATRSYESFTKESRRTVGASVEGSLYVALASLVTARSYGVIN